MDAKGWTTAMRALAIGLLLLPATAAGASSLSRDMLWVVTRTCVAAQRTLGRPFPCLEVAPGYAVLKAPFLDTEVVVMPTTRVVGLEAPVLQGPAGTAIWRAALDARHFVVDALKGRLPLQDVGLAVNSRGGRSQDQLHIHVDCVRPDVRAALDTWTAPEADWTNVPFRLAGRNYLALRVEAGPDLNPFAALARLPERPRLTMTSVAAVATRPGDPRPGFTLLALRMPGAHAEALLDHDCAIARTAPSR